MNLLFLEVAARDAIRLNCFQHLEDESNRLEVFWWDYHWKEWDYNYSEFRTIEGSVDVESLKRTENEFYTRLITEKEKFIPFSQYGKSIFKFESMKKENFELQKQLMNLLRSFGHPFFIDERTQQIFDSSQPYVIGLYGVVAAIRFYKQQIEKRIGSDYDEEICYVKRQKAEYLTEEQSTERLKYLTDLYEQHTRIWDKRADSCIGFFNLQPESENTDLVSSDLFEYEIINLYNILQHFEWGKKVLVFCVEGV